MGYVSDTDRPDIIERIARDAAVGRAVRRLEETGREWRIEARPMTYHIWTGVFGDPETIAPDIVSGVAAALRHEQPSRKP